MLVALMMPSAGAQAGPLEATFGSPRKIPASGTPYGIVTADLNRDTHVDLIYVNGVDVSVRLGNGVGGFGTAARFPTGDRPVYVDVGDVNGDTTLDLLTANVDSSTISVLLGTGDGGFVPHTDVPLRLRPFGLTLGDLNGDSLLDVATTIAPDSVEQQPFPGKVAILLGNSDGTFGEPIEFDTAAGPHEIEVGDFNGDTVLDLAIVATPTSNSGLLSVLIGHGDGTFAAPVDYGVGPESLEVATMDLNGDALLDVITASATASSASVLLGNADGTFGAATSFATGLSPHGVAAGDFNGDDVPDLATGNSLNGNASVLLGNGDGTFGPPTNYHLDAGHAASVGLADFNDDGRLDIAIGAWVYPASVSVLLNTTGVALPSAPTAGTATLAVARYAQAEVSVSWTAPNSDGGSPITGYVVTPYVGYYPLSPVVFDSPSTTQTITITGLSGGVTYRFKVAAINPLGTGPTSRVTNPVTTPTVPGAPAIGGAIAGDGEATVSWTPPPSDGGSPLTGYTVTPYIGYFPLNTRTFNSAATTQVVSGLSNGTTYRFRVRALNEMGSGSFSKASNPVTPSA